MSNKMFPTNHVRPIVISWLEICLAVSEVIPNLERKINIYIFVYSWMLNVGVTHSWFELDVFMVCLTHHRAMCYTRQNGLALDPIKEIIPKHGSLLFRSRMSTHVLKDMYLVNFLTRIRHKNYTVKSFFNNRRCKDTNTFNLNRRHVWIWS